MEVQEENEGVEKQVLKRKDEQRKGGDETSNEKKTSATGEEQATAAKESNCGSGEAEKRRGFPMLFIEQEGSQTVRTMTGLTTQSEGKTRSTTQSGDTTR